jgi:predicted oxidoreductase (fatty acid repression mutant protein)
MNINKKSQENRKEYSIEKSFKIYKNKILEIINKLFSHKNENLESEANTKIVLNKNFFDESNNPYKNKLDQLKIKMQQDSQNKDKNYKSETINNLELSKDPIDQIKNNNSIKK